MASPSVRIKRSRYQGLVANTDTCLDHGQYLCGYGGRVGGKHGADSRISATELADEARTECRRSSIP
jgi:hypothetical protein